MMRGLARAVVVLTAAALTASCQAPWANGGPEAGSSLEATARGYAAALVDGDGARAWRYLGSCRDDLNKDTYVDFIDEFSTQISARKITHFTHTRNAQGRVTSWTYLPGKQHSKDLLWVKDADADLWVLESC